MRIALLAALLAATLSLCPRLAGAQTAQPTGLASLSPAPAYHDTDTFALCQNGTPSCSLTSFNWLIGQIGGLGNYLSTRSDGLAHSFTNTVDQPAVALTDVALPSTIAVNAALGGDFTLTITGAGNSGLQPHMMGCPTNPTAGQLLRFWISEPSATAYNLAWDQRCYYFGGGPHLLAFQAGIVTTGGGQPDFITSANPGQASLIVCDTISAGATPQLNCGAPGQSTWNFGPFTPLYEAQSQIYIDPSIAASVFTGTACTGANAVATSGGATFGSVLDLSVNGACYTPTGLTYQLDGNGKPEFHSVGNASLKCNVGPGAGACNGIGENASAIIAAVGAKIPADTPNQDLVFIATNGTTTIPRFAAGWDVNGSAGEGPSIAGRAPDNQAATSTCNSGSIASLNTTATFSLQMTPFDADAFSSTNNGALAPSGGCFGIGTTNPVTDSTTNGGVWIGFNGTAGLQSGTNIYGVSVRVFSSGGATGAEQTQAATQWCSREGQNSGVGC